MTVLQRFYAALSSDQELPVLTSAEFIELVLDVQAGVEGGAFTQFDTDELSAGRFKGRGFGVDYSGGV